MRGEGEHMGDDPAQHETLGRLTQRVDDAVLPCAAAFDVADRGQPATGDGFVAVSERYGVVAAAQVGELIAVDRGQPDLLGQDQMPHRLGYRLVCTVPPQGSVPRQPYPAVVLL